MKQSKKTVNPNPKSSSVKQRTFSLPTLPTFLGDPILPTSLQSLEMPYKVNRSKFKKKKSIDHSNSDSSGPTSPTQTYESSSTYCLLAKAVFAAASLKRTPETSIRDIEAACKFITAAFQIGTLHGRKQLLENREKEIARLRDTVDFERFLTQLLQLIEKTNYQAETIIIHTQNERKISTASQSNKSILPEETIHTTSTTTESFNFRSPNLNSSGRSRTGSATAIESAYVEAWFKGQEKLLLELGVSIPLSNNLSSSSISSKDIDISKDNKDEVESFLTPSKPNSDLIEAKQRKQAPDDSQEDKKENLPLNKESERNAKIILNIFKLQKQIKSLFLKKNLEEAAGILNSEESFKSLDPEFKNIYQFYLGKIKKYLDLIRSSVGNTSDRESEEKQILSSDHGFLLLQAFKKQQNPLECQFKTTLLDDLFLDIDPSLLATMFPLVENYIKHVLDHETIPKIIGFLDEYQKLYSELHTNSVPLYKRSLATKSDMIKEKLDQTRETYDEEKNEKKAIEEATNLGTRFASPETAKKFKKLGSPENLDQPLNFEIKDDDRLSVVTAAVLTSNYDQAQAFLKSFYQAAPRTSGDHQPILEIDLMREDPTTEIRMIIMHSVDKIIAERELQLRRLLAVMYVREQFKPLLEYIENQINNNPNADRAQELKKNRDAIFNFVQNFSKDENKIECPIKELKKELKFTPKYYRSPHRFTLFQSICDNIGDINNHLNNIVNGNLSLDHVIQNLMNYDCPKDLIVPKCLGKLTNRSLPTLTKGNGYSGLISEINLAIATGDLAALDIYLRKCTSKDLKKEFDLESESPIKYVFNLEQQFKKELDKSIFYSQRIVSAFSPIIIYLNSLLKKFFQTSKAGLIALKKNLINLKQEILKDVYKYKEPETCGQSINNKLCAFFAATEVRNLNHGIIENYYQQLVDDLQKMALPEYLLSP